MAALISIAPGALAAVLVAAAAIGLDTLFAIPAIITALVIGLVAHPLATDARFLPGLDLVAKRVLRVGVALLGARITFSDVTGLGFGPVIMVLLLSSATILAGIGLCRVLGLGTQLGFLTGGAVAICGASAAIACSSILKQDKMVERDTMVTIIAVTALSTIAMLSYPLIFSWLGLNENQSGVLIGATIHDVAQVVGAGYAISESAGDTATYVKLLRVSMLPAVLVFAIMAIKLHTKRAGGKKVKLPFPLFVLAFAALVIVNSMGVLPEFVANGLSQLAQILLVAALGALGLRTALGSLRTVSGIYIVVLVLETVFLLGLGIAVIGFVEI